MLAVHGRGGGVGIGKAINGGFGLVLDGRKEIAAATNKPIILDAKGKEVWSSDKKYNRVEKIHLADLDA